MPIGSTNVYNPGDLILSTVSGSGTSFIETKIASATSSLILFNSSGTLTSASLNSTTVGTASYVSGSTSIITSITASNISASGKIQANQITASSILANNGPLMVTGSNAYIQMFPVGGFSLPTNLTASYIYTSGSTNDMYFTQYNGPYTNTTRLRWLESNLYTGILHGGVLTSTPGSTTFTVTEGEGLIVSLNAFTASSPYPTVKLISWATSTQPITYSGSAKITYVGINDIGGIVQQTNAWGSTDINQWDNQIELGVVLHLSGSVSSGVFNSQQISYGIPQQTDDFFRAFGPLKISGHTLQASGSSPTLSIKKTGGSAYREGANYVSNPNHPSTVVENDVNTSKIYRYYLSGSTPIIDTGINNAGYTTIDNDNYVNTATGQLATVGDSNWTIQRVFWIPNSPTNAFIVYYGNATYSTLLNAVNAKDSEPFTESPNTSLNAIFVGYIIIEGGIGKDLLNPIECTIIQGGLFRNVGGIGSSGTAPVSTTLAGLSDVALSGLAAGDLLVYGGGQWNNNKTLDGNYTITGSLTVTSTITGNLTGTSSWASNARTASYVVNSISSSYVSGSTSIITNLTASNISASGTSSFGYVGIGTTAPADKLSVISGSTRIASTALAGALYFGSDASNIYLQRDNNYDLSLVQNGDSNSALYLASAGNVYVNIDSNNNDTDKAFIVQNNALKSGTELFRVSETGNVGIGTSSPNAKLNIYTGGTGGIIINTGASTTSAYVRLVNAAQNWDLNTQTNNRFAIYDQTFAKQPFTIEPNTPDNTVWLNASGNVGIGTNNPLDKLSVSGSLGFYSKGNTRIYNAINATDTISLEGAGGLTFKTYSAGFNTAMVITTAGNVGIGTTSPNSKVHIVSDSRILQLQPTTSTSQFYIAFSNDNFQNNRSIIGLDNSAGNNLFASGGAAYALSIGTIDSRNIVFATANNERVRIDTTGNVGIGTTIPVAKLQVAGNISGSSFTSSISNAVGFLGTSSFATNATSASFASNTISSSYSLTSSFATTAQTANALNVDNSYTIAGLTNNGTLSQQGTLSMGSGYQLLLTTGTAPIPSLSFVGDTNTGIYSPSADIIGFSISGSEQVRIDSSGNLGIGTSSPLAKLDVRNQAMIGDASIGGVAYQTLSIGGHTRIHDTYRLQFGSANGGFASIGITGATTGTLTFTTWDGSAFVERLRIVNTNGNVGIGVTNPLGRLHITGSVTNGESLVYLSKGSGSITQHYITAVNQLGQLNYRVSSDINGHASQTLYYVGTPYVYHDTYWSSWINNNNYTQGGLGIGTTSQTHGYGVTIARPATSGSLYVSGSSVFTGSVNVSNNITCLSLTETSTEAVKYNILPLSSQLDNVLKLKPVSFNYKTNDKHSIGLIAEEVAKIYPEFTSDTNDSISYGKITSVLIQSIKELKTIIDNQQKQIEDLVNKLK